MAFVRIRQLRETTVAILLALALALAEPAWAKPVVAVFPIGGDGEPALRERIAMALRLKLDREGTYRPLDQFTMQDLAAEAGRPITASTDAALLKKVVDQEADILIWGELTRQAGSQALHLLILDLREPDSPPRVYRSPIAAPTDARFAVEQAAEMLPGVKPFVHPNEEPVHRDEQSERLWADNPNLAPDGDFSQAGDWRAIYESEKYPPPISTAPAPVDKLVILKQGEAQFLQMHLSRYAADNNGLACLGGVIPIEPETRYRVAFRYRSNGPVARVFVKGYTMHTDLTGAKVEREIYRRQIEPVGDTRGEWVTIEHDLNPQHPTFPVQHLRVNLYAYLHPGIIEFDDVVLKAVGGPTHRAEDEALKLPTTRQREREGIGEGR
jgi:hypothetical protein